MHSALFCGTPTAAPPRILRALVEVSLDEDDYNEPGDAVEEASRTLAGWWGPLIDEASLAVIANGDLVAAVVTERDAAHDRIPLLAYVLTDPSWQRRGIGTWLIGESVVALAVHRHNNPRLHGYLDDLPPAEFENVFLRVNRCQPEAPRRRHRPRPPHQRTHTDRRQPVPDSA